MFYKANQEHRFLQFVISIPNLHIDCYLGFLLKFIKLKFKQKTKTQKFKSRKPILNQSTCPMGRKRTICRRRRHKTSKNWNRICYCSLNLSADQLSDLPSHLWKQKFIQKWIFNFCYCWKHLRSHRIPQYHTHFVNIFKRPFS